VGADLRIGPMQACVWAAFFAAMLDGPGSGPRPTSSLLLNPTRILEVRFAPGESALEGDAKRNRGWGFRHPSLPPLKYACGPCKKEETHQHRKHRNHGPDARGRRT
jgi:hypothetical protein